jgi:ATP-dependent Lon protease
MKIFLLNLITLIILSSCHYKDEKENNLELEILNDTLYAFPYNSNKDEVNVLNYSIQNNSDQIYYFRQGLGDDMLLRKIYKNGIFITVHEATSNKEVNYSEKFPFEHFKRSDCDSCFNWKNSIRLIKDLERLEDDTKTSYYATRDKRHYFFIHPKEKLFFKQYINLTDSLRYEDTRLNYAHLDKNVKYYSKFFIPSDSNAYRQDLPNNILKTIQENNVKVYHGILKSKNNIPVKVLD